jgi:D-3-phosphoglycerate dehydrogenase
MPMSGERRICVLHANIPAVISAITSEISALGLNIENMINQSKGANAYTIIDVCGDISAEVVEKLKAVEGTIRVRVI